MWYLAWLEPGLAGHVVSLLDRTTVLPRLLAVLAALLLTAFATGSFGPFWAEASTQPDPGGEHAISPVQYAEPPATLPPQEFQVPATPDHPAYTLYSPGGVALPRAALLVLHGMGGNGPAVARYVLPYAQANGLVVIAPTIPYGDWRDPGQVTREMLALQPQLVRLLDAAPGETGIAIRERALLFGFSRGAQEALRFTLLYPERVRAVAALSAGTYTLPVASVQTASGAPLAAPLPFGVADFDQRTGRGFNDRALSHIDFWIAVGALDNRDADVPRQWDPYLGTNRVERARRFSEALARLGYWSELAVVPDTGHEITGAMLDRAIGFLRRTPVDVPAPQDTLARF